MFMLQALKDVWLIQSAKRWSTGSSTTAGSSFFRVVREAAHRSRLNSPVQGGSSGTEPSPTAPMALGRPASNGKGLIKETNDLVADDRIASTAENDKWQMLLLFLQQVCSALQSI
jgi:hypothetical protein